MDPHSRAPEKSTSHGNEVLPQDTMHFIQRPCYQRGSPCQDPAGNRTTRRPPDHRKETQTAVVWSCFPFIRSGQKPSCRAQSKGERRICHHHPHHTGICRANSIEITAAVGLTYSKRAMYGEMCMIPRTSIAVFIGKCLVKWPQGTGIQQYRKAGVKCMRARTLLAIANFQRKKTVHTVHKNETSGDGLSSKWNLSRDKKA